MAVTGAPTAELAHLAPEAISVLLRQVSTQFPKPHPVLLYNDAGDTKQACRWNASFDQARTWVYFASPDTPPGALAGRLAALMSGRIDLMSPHDWMSDDDNKQQRADPKERRELLKSFERNAQHQAEKDNAPIPAAEIFRASNNHDNLRQRHQDAEPALRRLQPLAAAAHDTLADTGQLPAEQLLELDNTLAETIDRLQHTVGGDCVTLVASNLRTALSPLFTALLFVGCDGETLVADECAQCLARLRSAVSAWLMSTSVGRITSDGAISAGGQIPASAYRDALSDMENVCAQITAADTADGPDIARGAEYLRRGLRRAGSTGPAPRRKDLARLESTASKFLRTAAAVPLPPAAPTPTEDHDDEEADD